MIQKLRDAEATPLDAQNPRTFVIVLDVVQMRENEDDTGGD
jgi:hypothetical protein